MISPKRPILIGHATGVTHRVDCPPLGMDPNLVAARGGRILRQNDRAETDSPGESQQ